MTYTRDDNQHQPTYGLSGTIEALDGWRNLLFMHKPIVILWMERLNASANTRNDGVMVVSWPGNIPNTIITSSVMDSAVIPLSFCSLPPLLNAAPTRSHDSHGVFSHLPSKQCGQHMALRNGDGGFWRSNMRQTLSLETGRDIWPGDWRVPTILSKSPGQSQWYLCSPWLCFTMFHWKKALAPQKV